MSNSSNGPTTTEERPALLIILGSVGFAGCAALLVGMIVAPFFVPDYNWVSDTISDLAAGNSEWIADFALFGFAAGLVAIALAASHAHLGKSLWSADVLSLAMLAVFVVIIGARNEYGDGDNEGVVIHLYLVIALGVLFLVTPLCLAPGTGRNHTRSRWMLVALGILWGLAAPGFFMVPTDIDGFYERGLGLVAAGMIAVLSFVFLSRGLHAMK